MGSTQDFSITQILDNHIFLKCAVDWIVSLASETNHWIQAKTQAATKTQWDLFLHPGFK